MTDRDIPAGALADVTAALALLTRLPVPASAHTPRPAALWAWPVAGVVVGALGALAAAAALLIGLPAGVAAALALAAQAAATGALHEDGLADTADGLYGGQSRTARLAIMKDSHIGSFGTLALVLVTLIRWTALATVLGATGPWGALIATGAVSRVPMAVLIATLPNARGSGLSHAVAAAQGRSAAAGAAAVGIGVALVLVGLPAVGMAALAAATTAGLARSALRRIGGQTGDILGASQQLAEAACLSALAAAA